MHPRHRSPGNGYRMGFGGSRIPDGARGRGGFYNSEYRSFNNRGFGRGQGHLRNFQHPPQPPAGKTDVLMEAGRLAAEYLVSKGLLPRRALSGKWQNGGFRKQVGNYQDFRRLEGHTQDDQTSAQLRMGTGVSDPGTGRKRYSDDFNLKSDVRDHRRGDYSRNYSSEWGREYGMSGSWSETSKVSHEDDTVSVKNEEQPLAKGDGVGTPKSSSSVASEVKEMANSEFQPENNSSDDIISKANSSTDENDETGQQPSMISDGMKSLNSGNEETKDSAGDRANEEQIAKDNVQIQESANKDILSGQIQQSANKDNLSGKNDCDLLALCKFANMPTKTRSALTSMASKVESVKVESVPFKEEENGEDVGASKGPAAAVQENGQDISATSVSVSASQDSKSTRSETSVVPANNTEHRQELPAVCSDVHPKCLRSQSFPNTAPMHYNKEHSNDGQQSIEWSISFEDKGEKRSIEEGVLGKEAKKSREWLPSLFHKVDEPLHPSNVNEPRSEQQAVDRADQDRTIDNIQYPEIVVKPGVRYAQERQLFPSSFKICDLNLMETSDLNDNHSNNQVLTYPSSGTIEAGAAQIDIDLSISNASTSRVNPRSTSSYRSIEVIDLEHNSIPEDKTFDLSDRKMEAENTGADGFSSHVQNSGDITDVQDNYDGLMISEFLIPFSNCSTGPEDINPLRNGMGLHNGEGTLGDDDSIYMSLGEIPFSFIPTWEQPMPQEYEKPF